jgi:hypothetical protein
MSVPERYTTCSNCGTLKRPEKYNYIEIEPKKGNYQSQLESNYCENCENFTLWFMGRGIPKLDSDPLWAFNPLKEGREERIKVNKELKQNYEKIKNYSEMFFLVKLLFTFKIRKEKKQGILLEKKLAKLIKEDRERLNVPSVKFYKKISPKPKCLECGSNRLNKPPKHSCGGDITLVNGNITYFRSMSYYKKTELWLYDEYGKLEKTKL